MEKKPLGHRPQVFPDALSNQKSSTNPNRNQSLLKVLFRAQQQLWQAS
jgi:hypothetical protein